MSENDHAIAAKFRLNGVHEWQCEEGATDATSLALVLDAQVEATLALAYEQRTANLIAIWLAAKGMPVGTAPTGTYSKIAERLDLK